MSVAKRSSKRKASFGLALECDSRAVPPVVAHLIEYFDNRGCDDEGIFRISAKIDDVEKLRKAMDKDKPSAVDLTTENIHVLANLLKLYFRELPEPLLTFESYSSFVNVAKLPEDQRIDRIKSILSNLPMSNRTLTKYLFQFLSRVSLRKNKNKMNANNLAIVFAPSILRPSDPLLVLGGASDATFVVEIMITFCEQIFETEPDHERGEFVVLSKWNMRGSTGYEIDLVKLESELKELNRSDPLPSNQPPPLFPAARNTSAPLILKNKKNKQKSFIEPGGFLPTAEGPRDVPRRSGGKVIGSTAGPRRYSQPVSDRTLIKVLPGPLLSEDVRLSSSLPKPLSVLPSPRKQKSPKHRRTSNGCSSSDRSPDSSM